MEIPSLQSEVNRKAIETLSWLTDSVVKNQITKEQFSIGIDALFMAVSGLVSDRDFIHYITEAQKFCEETPAAAVVPEAPKTLEVW